jgi:hypothetical protein
VYQGCVISENEFPYNGGIVNTYGEYPENDYSMALDVDTSGGVYVTGYGRIFNYMVEDIFRYATLKYGSAQTTGSITAVVYQDVDGLPVLMPGVTVTLSGPDSYYQYTQTGEDGEVAFDELEAGTYTVELFAPLGFIFYPNGSATVDVSGNANAVNFTVKYEPPEMGLARGKGYWKHQFKGNGNTDYGATDLEGFATAIFEHFYYFQPDASKITVDGVTYDAGTGNELALEAIEDMLSINHNGSTKYERACQHFLTLLLNVVSNKLGQLMDATDDGASVSQTIWHIYGLLDDVDQGAENNELAKDIAETINEGQMVEAGVISTATPEYLFGDESEPIAQPSTFHFSGPVPNPFNPTTSLSLQLPEAADVKLHVYNINGSIVTELIDGWKDAGVHEAVFNGAGLSSGVYLYRLQAGEYNEIGRMVLMK